MRRFLADVDLTGFKLVGALMNPLSSDPAGLGSSDEGRVWINTTTHKLMYWNGTAAIDALARANHSGTQLAATISNLAATVQAYSLSTFAVPTGDLAMGGFKITGAADGVSNSDVATYGQVLALINNQVFKKTVRAATTAAITLSAPQTVDGVSVIAGDRVLVKDQASALTNGIYVVQAGAWVRATDFDSSAEVTPGAIIPVEDGTVNGNSLFMLTTNGPIVLNTTALVFASYGASSGEIGVAGAGLTKTGVTYAVGANTGITVNADDIAADFSVVARKLVANIPATTSGNFTVTSGVVVWTHSLNNLAARPHVVMGSVPLAGTVQGQPVEVDYVNTDANTITFTLPNTPATNNYVVSGIG